MMSRFRDPEAPFLAPLRNLLRLAVTRLWRRRGPALLGLLAMTVPALAALVAFGIQGAIYERQQAHLERLDPTRVVIEVGDVARHDLRFTKATFARDLGEPCIRQFLPLIEPMVELGDAGRLVALEGVFDGEPILAARRFTSGGPPANEDQITLTEAAFEALGGHLDPSGVPIPATVEVAVQRKDLDGARTRKTQVMRICGVVDADPALERAYARFAVVDALDRWSRAAHGTPRADPEPPERHWELHLAPRDVEAVRALFAEFAVRLEVIDPESEFEERGEASLTAEPENAWSTDERTAPSRSTHSDVAWAHHSNGPAVESARSDHVPPSPSTIVHVRGGDAALLEDADRLRSTLAFSGIEALAIYDRRAWPAEHAGIATAVQLASDDELPTSDVNVGTSPSIRWPGNDARVGDRVRVTFLRSIDDARIQREYVVADRTTSDVPVTSWPEIEDLEAWRRGDVRYDTTHAAFAPVPVVEPEPSWVQAKVYARQLEDVASVAATFRHLGYQTRDHADDHRALLELGTSLRTLVFLIVGGALLIATLNFVTSTLQRVQSETFEIGVLRAHGASNAWVVALYTAQGLVLGWCAFLAAMLLAPILAPFAHGAVAASFGLPDGLLEHASSFGSFAWVSLLFAVTTSCATLGSSLPATWCCRRLSPVQALVRGRS